MTKQTYYPLGVSQSTVNMQSMFSRHKEVMNINLMFTPKQNWDYATFCKALDVAISRNDCLRIQFKPHFLSWRQTFLPERHVEVPVLDFSEKTQQQQEAEIQKWAQIPINLKHGGVPFRVFFVHTFDGKTAINLNVSHLIFDIFGLVFFLEDLYGIYTALTTGAEMPPAPSSFEDVVKSDIAYTKSPKFEADKKYYADFFKSRHGTQYVGMHGEECEFWQKRKAQGKRMKMFLTQNAAEVTGFNIGKDIVEGIEKTCAEYKLGTPTLFIYTALMTTLWAINQKEQKILALNLCNGRATAKEMRCGGTIAQSLPIGYDMQDNLTFAELVTSAKAQEKNHLKHLKFPEVKREGIMHKGVGSKMGDMNYPFTFSFLPAVQSDKYEYRFYSSKRFVVPGYLAFSYDMLKKEIFASYIYQTKLQTEQHIIKFHNQFLQVLDFITQKPECTLAEIYDMLTKK